MEWDSSLHLSPGALYAVAVSICPRVRSPTFTVADAVDTQKPLPVFSLADEGSVGCGQHRDGERGAGNQPLPQPLGSLLTTGACYRALRRLPGQDSHLLEQRVFQDAPWSMIEKSAFTNS